MYPKIVTANRLVDGAVVYAAADGSWSPLIADAFIVDNEPAEISLMTKAQESVRQNQVVEPYLIEVARETTRIKPVRYREIIRATGPSTHPHVIQKFMPAGAVAAGTTLAMVLLNGI